MKKLLRALVSAALLVGMTLLAPHSGTDARPPAYPRDFHV